MKAQTITTTALAALFCVPLPAVAADSQFLTLVMPNAKVVAGINVQQALATPFGQHVLTLIAPHDQEIQALATLVGFDPRHDVTELLVASSGAGLATAAAGGAPPAGLVLARGRFDPSKIVAAATLAKCKSESYAGLTVLEDEKQTSAVAFPDATLAIMGDVASVKAAIDRLGNKTTSLPAAALTQVNQWSLSQDAWVVSTAPLASLKLPSGAPSLPGPAQAAALQAIQQAAGGVKFGATVVLTGQAQTDTPQNATALAGLIQLVSNMAQTQANQNPQAGQLWKSLQVSAQGNTLNLSMSVPQDQVQQLFGSTTAAPRKTAPAKKM